MNDAIPTTSRRVTGISLGLVVVFTVTALFIARLLGPSDLIDYGQEWPTSYVLDAVKNGHWIVQTDIRGEITSKPPLYTWLAATAAVVAGGVNRLTLTLPAFLATGALALILLGFGAKQFGWRAGFLAAMVYLLSPVVAKQVALVRTDGLFSLTVAATALLAFRAWQTGKGWTWFWLAAAVATLTKGPLGVLLAGLGLLAVFWERRTGNPAPIKGSHWAGVCVFLVVAFGWFAAAYLEAGRALSDRMLVRELYGRAISKGEGSMMGQGFYLATAYFLSRYAPWSLLTCVALWRVWKEPAQDPSERRFDRFLFCWFVFGLAIFSLAAHQRPDLIFPLIPAAALLAGRELSRWLAGWSDRNLISAAAGVALVVAVGVGVAYGEPRLANEAVAQTLAAEKLADMVLQQVGDGFPLVHADSSPVMQMRLGTADPLVSPERAAQLLRGEAAAFVVVKDADATLARLSTNTVQVVAAAPRTRRTQMAVVSNRPKLAWSEPLTTVVGPLRLELSGVRKFTRRDNEFWLEVESKAVFVELTNESEKPIAARIHFAGEGVASTEVVTLPPDEMRKVIWR
jgi:4-amino-4-deoxy-L-arabinose transferase-like glycosyltransferase